MSEAASAHDQFGGIVPEPRKLGAFVRRDLLIAWSYRLAYLQDALGLVLQIFTFYFVSRLVDPARIQGIGATRASYLGFVTIGIAVAGFIQVALVQVTSQMRSEQLTGTLEALLVTPTSAATLQLGLVIYDLLYVPIRTAIFLLLVSVTLGVDFSLAGLLPATVVLLALIPFVWGLGSLCAASVLTIRRGSGFVGLAASALTVGSGAYFPIGLLPSGAARVVQHSPVAIALQAMRHALLNGAGWASIVDDIAVLVPMAVLSLCVGHVVFRLALQRERRLGTLGVY